MPVHLDHSMPEDQWRFREPDANSIEIALVNNMPSGAMEATERQFRTLLEAAAGGITIRLFLVTLPDVPRSPEARLRVMRFYSSFKGLCNRHLDGIIVTGAEPCASHLAGETYWKNLTGLMDWAEANTFSSVWSCLAAHAAVLHLDGIEREPLASKLSGVFECSRASDDPLTTHFPARSWMPHSRWNDVPEIALGKCGYRILLRSNEAGACSFAKERKSLFLFFQGHPEYESDTLLLEYRRDIKRFLRHERETYPNAPQACFDRTTMDRLASLRSRAAAERSEELLNDFPFASLAAGVRNTWRPAAVRVYRNWLLQLCASKARWMRSRARRPEGAKQTRAEITTISAAATFRPLEQHGGEQKIES